MQPFTFRKLVRFGSYFVKSLDLQSVLFIVFLQFDLDLMSGTCFIVIV